MENDDFLRFVLSKERYTGVRYVTLRNPAINGEELLFDIIKTVEGAKKKIFVFKLEKRDALDIEL